MVRKTLIAVISYLADASVQHIHGMLGGSSMPCGQENMSSMQMVPGKFGPSLRIDIRVEKSGKYFLVVEALDGSESKYLAMRKQIQFQPFSLEINLKGTILDISTPKSVAIATPLKMVYQTKSGIYIETKVFIVKLFLFLLLLW